MTSSTPSAGSLESWLRSDPAAVRKAVEAERLRRDFGAWLPVVSPSWTWSWRHLELIRAQLARVTRGELRKLMLFCPPRHGKSEQNTVRYSAWRLERDPSQRIIIGAYNQTLAEKFSRKVRRIAEDRVPISTDRTAVADWETTEGGGVRAVGVGGGITGMGGDLILIDDPVKSRAEAESQAYRDRCFDWYTDDLYTRQEPGCAIVLTMTRWHADDLAGRILASDDGPSWTVVNLPALADENDPLGRMPGEALCPERYDVEQLAAIRRVLKRNFWALYQGSPQPAEGGTFKRSWFRYWEDAGDFLRLDAERSRIVRKRDLWRFGIIDQAFSVRKAADYTVVSAWGVSPAGDLILLDLVREQMEAPELLPLVRRFYERHGLQYLGTEQNGAQLSFVQSARKADLPIRGLKSDLDKVTRSIEATIRMEAGTVFFPKSAPWLADMEHELLSFPNGAHDDMCLAAGTMIETDHGPRPIETIRPGDIVLTRKGYRVVLAAGMTNPAACVRTVFLSNGNTLIGTPNHPVWVEGKGFVPIDCLDYADIICVCGKSTSDQNPSGTTASSSGAIQRRVNGLTGCTLGPTPDTSNKGSAASTKKSGRRLTVQFPKATTFITGTAIHSTMPWKIWSAFLRAFTARSTGSKETIQHQPSRHTLKRFGISQPNGTDQKKDFGGIASTQGTEQNPRPQLSEIAITAANGTQPRSRQRKRSTVPLPALQRRGEHRESTTNPEIAKGAVRSFAPTATARLDFANPGVVAVRQTPGLWPVYNLTVADTSEYFASGILVHNCDCLSYAAIEVMKRHGPPADHAHDAEDLDADPLSGKGELNW